MSGNQTQEREDIKKCCKALKELLDSLKGTSEEIKFAHEDVARISGAAQRCAYDDLEELALQLKKLLVTLKNTPAADGEPILSGPRHQKFLKLGTCTQL